MDAGLHVHHHCARLTLGSGGVGGAELVVQRADRGRTAGYGERGRSVSRRCSTKVQRREHTVGRRDAARPDRHPWVTVKWPMHATTVFRNVLALTLGPESCKPTRQEHLSPCATVPTSYPSFLPRFRMRASSNSLCTTGTLGSDRRRQ